MIIEKYIMSFPNGQIENLNLLKKNSSFLFYFIINVGWWYIDNQLEKGETR